MKDLIHLSLFLSTVEKLIFNSMLLGKLFSLEPRAKPYLSNFSAFY